MKSHTFLCLAGALAAHVSALGASELVNLKAVDPTIEVELRYATERNVTGHALYPPNMPALLRPSVAAKLAVAQNYVQASGFRLKVWDAYRPRAAQEQLWQYLPNRDFVANPTDGASLHTWGVAVDATLVDARGYRVSMPTDFDEFTPAAMLRYLGPDGNIREHLHILQRAMGRAGFYGMRTEWWHFIAHDWKQYKAIDTLKLSAAR